MGELDVSDLISVEAATAIVDGVPVDIRSERRDLRELEGRGMYLAEDIRADRDSPPFDKSLMDGYAVIAADVQNAPRELRVVETVAAGESSRSRLRPGEAVAIMTGAPIPPGADAVVPVEHTQQVGSGRVLIQKPTAPGKSIAPRGSDAVGNSVVLKVGAKLGAPQLAVAASVGAVSLPVYRCPRVGVLTTGDELVGSEVVPSGSQIRSTNDIMLLSLLSRLPVHVANLGHVRDDPDAIRLKIQSGLQSEDVLLITGGMSMGQRDFVPGILRALGCDLKITKLRVKPGKPFVFATFPGNRFVFGLPGNPVSAFVCTLYFASRLLMRIAGGPPDLPKLIAPLATSLAANGPRTFFQPAFFADRVITPLDWKGSADIFTLARANALIVRPENDPPQAAGESISFLSI